MLLSVLGILFPVFAMLALGAWLRHTGFLSEAFAAGLNKLVFYGALPCLLVDSISRSDPTAGSGRASLALALGTVGIAVVAWILAVPMGVSRASRPSFCQSVFRSNNAYVGLPVMALAFAGRDFYAEGMALAMLTLAPCLLLYNGMAVVVLTRPDESAPPLRRLGRVLLGILRNPLILACLSGLALLALRLRLGVSPADWAASPNPLLKTIRLFGTMATPGSLAPAPLHRAVLPGVPERGGVLRDGRGDGRRRAPRRLRGRAHDRLLGPLPRGRPPTRPSGIAAARRAARGAERTSGAAAATLRRARRRA